MILFSILRGPEQAPLDPPSHRMSMINISIISRSLTDATRKTTRPEFVSSLGRETEKEIMIKVIQPLSDLEL